MERKPAFAFEVENSRKREGLKPTLEEAISYLKKMGCSAYYAVYRQPIVAYYMDGQTERLDLSPYTEPCEPDEGTRVRVEKEIDEIIEDNEARWAELVAKTPPGERPCAFSGQFTLFRRDRQEGIAQALKRYQVKWREDPV